jgi:DNA-binding MarR family transcriptional regulator
MTRWLTEEQQVAWRGLAAVIHLLPNALEAALRDTGLSYYEYLVLAMLSEAPGRTLRMSELAGMTNASASRLSHVARRLEERGWLRREPCPEDGRATLALLTDAGHDRVVQAAPAHVESVQELVFDALTADQVAELEEICASLLARIAPEGALPQRLHRGTTASRRAGDAPA